MGVRQIILRISLALTGLAGIFCWSLLFATYRAGIHPALIALAFGIPFCVLLARARKIGILHYLLWAVAFLPIAVFIWWIFFGKPIRMF